MKKRDLKKEKKFEQEVNGLRIEIDNKIGKFAKENIDLQEELEALEDKNDGLRRRSRILINSKFGGETFGDRSNTYKGEESLLDSIDNLDISGINSEIESLSIH